MPTKIVKCLRGLCLADLSIQNLAAITETLTHVLLNNILNLTQICAKIPTRNVTLLCCFLCRTVMVNKGALVGTTTNYRGSTALRKLKRFPYQKYPLENDKA